MHLPVWTVGSCRVGDTRVISYKSVGRFAVFPARDGS